MGKLLNKKMIHGGKDETNIYFARLLESSINSCFKILKNKVSDTIYHGVSKNCLVLKPQFIHVIYVNKHNTELVTNAQ